MLFSILSNSLFCEETKNCCIVFTVINLASRQESSGGDGGAVIGAFSGWKVILCVDKSRQPGFKRLLEAGGAQVVRVRPPFDDTDGVTHAFIGLY